MDPLAAEALSELASDHAVADPWVIECLADHLTEGGLDLDVLAERAGVSVVETPFPMHGFYTRGLVFVRSGLSERTRRVVVTHECCHPVATLAGFGECHPDVWRLSLATMMPRAVIGRHPRSVEDVAARCGVPWWAAWARLKMAAITAVRRR